MDSDCVHTAYLCQNQYVLNHGVTAIVEFCTMLRLISWGQSSAQNSNKLKGGLIDLRFLLEGSSPHNSLVESWRPNLK